MSVLTENRVLDRILDDLKVIRLGDLKPGDVVLVQVVGLKFHTEHRGVVMQHYEPAGSGHPFVHISGKNFDLKIDYDQPVEIRPWHDATYRIMVKV